MTSEEAGAKLADIERRLLGRINVMRSNCMGNIREAEDDLVLVRAVRQLLALANVPAVTCEGAFEVKP